MGMGAWRRGNQGVFTGTMQPARAGSNARVRLGHYFRQDMQATASHRPLRSHRVSWPLAAALLLPLLGACSESASGPKATALASIDSAGQVMFGVRAPLTDKGKSVGLLQADSGFVYDDGMRLEFRRVTVTLVNPEGTPLSVTTARAASYSLADSRLDLRATVEITANTGQRLQTSALTFDVSRNRMTSDSAYTLTATGGKVTKGTGFVAIPSLTRVVSAAEQAKLDADSAKAAAAQAAKDQAAREKAAAAAAKAARAAPKPATKPRVAPPAPSRGAPPAPALAKPPAKPSAAPASGAAAVPPASAQRPPAL